MLAFLTVFSVLLVCVFLGALTVIDFKTFLLPNKLVLGVFLCGVAFHLLTDFEFVVPLEIVFGGSLGAGFLYVLRIVTMYFYKTETLGLGDVKLMGAVGVWLGVDYILLAITFGAVCGVLHGLGLATYIRYKSGNFPSLNTLMLPAGPGFILGSILTAVYVFYDLPFVLMEMWHG